LFCVCDFSKAFDKVWHRGLLHKLKAYGITGNLIDWFSSYSNGRRQKVVIKNNSSAYCEISAGVPQASVLNPLLFIIYINDIADKLVSLSRLFADDTSFGYLKNQDTMQLKNVIDHDLNEMDIW
jgi:retron-type reverse transcriptase